MPTGRLSGFVWDERLRGGRYRRVLPDGRLGRIVSRDTVVGSLREIARNAEKAFGDLAGAVAERQITVLDGQLAGEYLLKDLYNAYSALARGGWSKLDADALARNAQILSYECEQWRKFMQDAADGGLTENQLRARARLYAGKAYSRYWAEDRLRILLNRELREERWLDTQDERECGDCPKLAALGWVPIGSIGTVPGAGATECLGNCRCELAYR